MKRKELKNIATKIAKLERTIQNATSSEEREKAEKEIMSLSFGVGNLSDLDLIDEMVQEILEKNS